MDTKIWIEIALFLIGFLVTGAVAGAVTASKIESIAAEMHELSVKMDALGKGQAIAETKIQNLTEMIRPVGNRLSRLERWQAAATGVLRRADNTFTPPEGT